MKLQALIEPAHSVERLCPYLPADIDSPVAQEIRKRRKGFLLNLDRMLLYNEQIANGWNTLFGALRNSLSLDPKHRELCICYVGLLNNAAYEVDQHMPEFMKSGGTLDHIDSLRCQEFDIFTQEERRMLKCCEMITFGNEVDQAMRRKMIDDLGSVGAFVEFTALIAGYNCCSRVL